MAAPVAAAAAPEGFSNGFGNAPPMMGTNPGLSLGILLARRHPACPSFSKTACAFCLFSAACLQCTPRQACVNFPEHATDIVQVMLSWVIQPACSWAQKLYKIAL